MVPSYFFEKLKIHLMTSVLTPKFKDNQRPYLKGVLIYRDVFLMYNK